MDLQPPTGPQLAVIRRATARIYIRCFPLLLMDVVRRTHPLALHQFLLVNGHPMDLAPGLDDDDDQLVLASAWIELSAGPVVLRLPPSKARYFSLTFIDTAGGLAGSLGSWTGRDGGENLALMGPNWTGQLPAGLTGLRMPSESVWALSRLYAHSALDLGQTLEIAARLFLTPLEGEPAPVRTPMATLEAPTPAALRQVFEIDPASFLLRLGRSIRRAPSRWRPAALASATEALKRAAGPSEAWDAECKQALSDGIADGVAAIRAAAGSSLRRRTPGVHGAGGDAEPERPLKRAARAFLQLGAPMASDILTLVGDRDGSHRLLTGRNKYRVRFARGAAPPAKAFWRLSARPGGPAHFPREVGDRSDLTMRPDGSVEIFVQASPPEPPCLSNWLACPEGAFSLVLRLCAPDLAAIDAGWRMPRIATLRD